MDETKRKAEKSLDTDISQPKLRRKGSLPDLTEPMSMLVPEVDKIGFIDPGVKEDVISCEIHEKKKKKKIVIISIRPSQISENHGIVRTPFAELTCRNNKLSP